MINTRHGAALVLRLAALCLLLTSVRTGWLRAMLGSPASRQGWLLAGASASALFPRILIGRLLPLPTVGELALSAFSSLSAKQFAQPIKLSALSLLAVFPRPVWVPARPVAIAWRISRS